MIGLLKNELLKFFNHKKLVWFLGLLTILYLLPVLMTVFVKIKTFDGQIFPYTMASLITAWIMPIVLIVIIAESITDEYTSGTLSLSLVHPISRTQLITAKLVALLIITTFLLTLAMLLGYGIGTLFFGWDADFMIRGVVYSTAEGIKITATTFLAPVFPLMAFSAMILFLALLLSGSAAVVGVSIGILLTYTFADLLIKEIQPYLINAYFALLPTMLSFPTSPPKLRFALVFITVHGLVFYLASLMLFNKRDVLS